MPVRGGTIFRWVWRPLPGRARQYERRRGTGRYDPARPCRVARTACVGGHWDGPDPERTMMTIVAWKRKGRRGQSCPHWMERCSDPSASPAAACVWLDDACDRWVARSERIRTRQRVRVRLTERATRSLRGRSRNEGPCCPVPALQSRNVGGSGWLGGLPAPAPRACRLPIHGSRCTHGHAGDRQTRALTSSWPAVFGR